MGIGLRNIPDGLGSYGTTLALSDYIILDCRTSYPTIPHPGKIPISSVIVSLTQLYLYL
jgi:hypothetical protein